MQQVKPHHFHLAAAGVLGLAAKLPWTPSLEAVLALDGRNFAMLSSEEREALQFYQDQGRKFDVSVAILSDADPKELELASRAQADDIMKRANSHVQITLGPDAQERFKLMRLCKEHGRSEEFYVIKLNDMPYVREHI